MPRAPRASSRRPIDRSPRQAAELPEDDARSSSARRSGRRSRRRRSTSPIRPGKRITLDQFRGKNVLLTFYLGAGCAHCVKQVKDLSERADEWARLDTVVITVSQDAPESNAKSQELSPLKVTLGSDRALGERAPLQVVRRLRGDRHSLDDPDRQGWPRALGPAWRRAVRRLQVPHLAAAADEPASRGGADDHDRGAVGVPKPPSDVATRVLLGTLIAASALSSQAPDLRTRAEATDYVETSSYDDVMRVVQGRRGGERRWRKFESFGTSEEGRALPLLILSEPAVATPEAAQPARPANRVRPGQHSRRRGRGEGSVAHSRAAPVVRRSAAAAEAARRSDRADLQRRRQRAGRRARTAPSRTVPRPVSALARTRKGLDLNRDYMKLESAEARALVGLMNRWDPARRRRSAHDQRLVSRLPPDLFADAQPQRRCAADCAGARADPAGGAARRC